MAIEPVAKERNDLGRAVKKGPLRSHRLLALATLTPALVAAALSSVAQVSGGASAKPEVEVNLGVLDSLSAHTAGVSSSAARIVLHPPKGIALKGRAAGDGQPASPEPSPKQAVLEKVDEVASAAATAPTPPAQSAVLAPAVAPDHASLAPGVAPATAVASLPAASTTATAAQPSRALNRILFTAKAVQLENPGKSELDALARWLGAHQQAHLRLMAYAGADEAGDARRLSLARVLAVRSYLVEHGVSSTRMEARVLGNRSAGGDPPDRVDIATIDR